MVNITCFIHDLLLHSSLKNFKSSLIPLTRHTTLKKHAGGHEPPSYMFVAAHNTKCWNGKLLDLNYTNTHTNINLLWSWLFCA